MPRPCIPTLMSSVSQLTKPLDIIKYVLRSYLNWPKNISDTFAEREVSFTYDVALIGWDPDNLTDRARKALTNVLTVYFPQEASIDVDVTVEVIDQVRYDVKFDIVIVSEGVPYRFETNQTVDDKGRLVYDFEGTEEG